MLNNDSVFEPALTEKRNYSVSSVSRAPLIRTSSPTTTEFCVNNVSGPGPFPSGEPTWLPFPPVEVLKGWDMLPPGRIEMETIDAPAGLLSRE